MKKNRNNRLRSWLNNVINEQIVFHGTGVGQDEHGVDALDLDFNKIDPATLDTIQSYDFENFLKPNVHSLPNELYDMWNRYQKSHDNVGPISDEAYIRSMLRAKDQSSANDVSVDSVEEGRSRKLKEMRSRFILDKVNEQSDNKYQFQQGFEPTATDSAAVAAYRLGNPLLKYNWMDDGDQERLQNMSDHMGDFPTEYSDFLNYQTDEFTQNAGPFINTPDDYGQGAWGLKDELSTYWQPGGGNIPTGFDWRQGSAFDDEGNPVTTNIDMTHVDDLANYDPNQYGVESSDLPNWFTQNTGHGHSNTNETYKSQAMKAKLREMRSRYKLDKLK